MSDVALDRPSSKRKIEMKHIPSLIHNAEQEDVVKIAEWLGPMP